MIRFLKVISFASFLSFSFALLFIPVANLLLHATILVFLVLAILSYLIGIRVNKFGLVSFSWLLLGVNFLVTWIFIGQFVSYFLLFLLETLLIGFFEISRFAFISEPVVQSLQKLKEEESKRFEDTGRNHATILLLVLALSFFSSLASANFFGGFLISPSPTVGVAIFAFFAIFLIALLVLRKKY